MNQQTVLLSIFFGSVAALLYTYAGYPVLVYAVSRFFPKKVNKNDHEPTVTVLITAYNEEQGLFEKLENTLRLDYPKDKLEILVASDGSTDRTDEIAKEFESKGVKLFRQEGRKGKTYTQNMAVEKAAGEIILFSDATTDYSPDVIRKLVPYFADPTVGCAAGRLEYVDSEQTDVGKGAKSYWNYETFLKQSESDACSLIGASGCLYAVRKSAYKPMYPEACSDFLICTVLYEQKLRSVFVPEAVCREETNRDAAKEFQMRVRVISQTFTDLWRNRAMLNPFKSGFYAVQLLSHKVLRYAVPLFLLSLLVSSMLLALNSVFFSVLSGLQTGFYFLGIVAYLFESKGRKIGIPSVFLYFLLANIASVSGFYKFLLGERYAAWEPIRDENPAGDSVRP